MTTPAEHAATVRKVLLDKPYALAALDALQAQAEQDGKTIAHYTRALDIAEAERDELQRVTVETVNANVYARQAAEAERDQWKKRAEYEEDQKRIIGKEHLRLAARVSELEDALREMVAYSENWVGGSPNTSWPPAPAPRSGRGRRGARSSQLRRDGPMSVPILICALCRNDVEGWSRPGCVRGVCENCRKGVWVTIPRIHPEADLWCERCGVERLLAVQKEKV